MDDGESGITASLELLEAFVARRELGPHRIATEIDGRRGEQHSIVEVQRQYAARLSFSSPLRLGFGKCLTIRTGRFGRTNCPPKPRSCRQISSTPTWPACARDHAPHFRDPDPRSQGQLRIPSLPLRRHRRRHSETTSPRSLATSVSAARICRRTPPPCRHRSGPMAHEEASPSVGLERLGQESARFSEHAYPRKGHVNMHIPSTNVSAYSSHARSFRSRSRTAGSTEALDCKRSRHARASTSFVTGCLKSTTWVLRIPWIRSSLHEGNGESQLTSCP